MVAWAAWRASSEFDKLRFPFESDDAAFLETGVDEQIVESRRKDQQKSRKTELRRVAQNDDHLLSDTDKSFDR
jgi:hypothetical protein